VGISATDRAPVAVPESLAASEDTAVLLDLLANDSDPDGDPLSVLLESAPVHGSAVIDVATGQVVYTPDADYSGPDSFTYRACAGMLCSATVVTSLIVHPVNDAPAAVADVLVAVEDTAASVAVLANDSDVDGDALTTVLVGQPAHGTATIDPITGGIVYTPEPDFVGSDSFTYRACDAALCSVPVPVTVSVAAVNDAPTGATSPSLVTPQGSQVSGSVSATDPDGDQLTFTPASVPAKGSVLMTAGGGFSYAPAPGSTGTDFFTYTVCDPGGLCASGTVTITITPAPAVNRPPAAHGDTAVTRSGESVSIPVLMNDSDPDGDPMTVVDLSTPPHGTAVLVGDGVVYTPSPGFVGTDAFTYTVGDGHGGLQVQTVIVTITGPEPVLTPVLPAPTPAPTPAPKPAPAPAPTPTQLPRTGLDSAAVLGWSFVSLTMGGLLLLAGRRRREA
ncbi:MAG: hypothetical protein JWL64_754, partial [Frankiales bacterium]|nr:hypothetical protein [Frankiales bacterium]